jgi:hypothetical protein
VTEDSCWGVVLQGRVGGGHLPSDTSMPATRCSWQLGASLALLAALRSLLVADNADTATTKGGLEGFLQVVGSCVPGNIRPNECSLHTGTGVQLGQSPAKANLEASNRAVLGPATLNALVCIR